MESTMAIIRSIARNAIILTVASTLEFSMQLLVPIVLVRHLSPEIFAQYRLIWLLAATLLAFFPAFMPQSLFYFLPRVTGAEKTTVITNVVLYLGLAGIAAAVIVSAINPLISGAVRQLSIDSNHMVPVFLAMWILVSLNTTMPVAEGRIVWQANSDVILSLLRTGLLCFAVLFFGTLLSIVCALLIDACARVIVLALYIFTRKARPKFSFCFNLGVRQFRYCLPFAISNSLFLFRAQIDQWAVAFTTGASALAIFSIGAVLNPLASLIRQPLYNATAPRLSAAFINCDLHASRILITGGISYTVLILVPAVGGFLLISRELVELVYTAQYLEALPVMRVYLVGIAISSLSVSYALPSINKGAFAVKNNAICLVLSSFFSVALCLWLGPVGAATGSVLTLLVSEVWSMRVVAAALDSTMFKLLPVPMIAWVSCATALCFYIAAVAQPVFDRNVFLVLLSKGVLYVLALLICAAFFRLLSFLRLSKSA